MLVSESSEECRRRAGAEVEHPVTWPDIGRDIFAFIAVSVSHAGAGG
jgi:hypothetical protein